MLTKRFAERQSRAPRVHELSGLVLYDDLCGLCDHTVRFLLHRDKRGVLKYAPLGGETAGDIRQRHQSFTEDKNSVVLVLNFNTPREKLYFRSDAGLLLLREIGGFWWYISLLRFLPRFLRDPVYRLIAKNRRRWFGTMKECRVWKPEDRDRFLP